MHNRDYDIKLRQKIETLRTLMFDMRRSVGAERFDQSFKTTYTSSIKWDDLDCVKDTGVKYILDLQYEMRSARRALRPEKFRSVMDDIKRRSTSKFSEVEGNVYRRTQYHASIQQRSVIYEAAAENRETTSAFIPVDYVYRIEKLGVATITFAGKKSFVIDALQIKSPQLEKAGMALYRGVVGYGTAKGMRYEEARFAKHLETAIVAAGRTAKQAISHADRDAVKAMLDSVI